MPSSQRGHRLRRIDQLVEKHRNPTIGMFDGAGMIADLIVACRKEAFKLDDLRCLFCGIEHPALK